MPNGMNLIGSNVIVYDAETQKVLAQTQILDFDDSLYILTISREAYEENESGQVRVLVLNAAFFYEYRGTVRKIGQWSPRVEIALYKGQVKDNRDSIRYPVNAKAWIDRLVRGQTAVTLSTPIEVLLVNMSTAGCLILAGRESLKEDMEFYVRAQIGGNEIALHAQVVRVNPANGPLSEFGCKFIYDE